MSDSAPIRNAMTLQPLVDEHGRRTAIDGASRRRIYLFRHGAVSYIDTSGKVVADTNAVDLNQQGRAQAAQMSALFAEVSVDRVLHSGLPRTQQTAEIVLGNRGIKFEADGGFREIQQSGGNYAGDYDVVADVAFSHCRAVDEEARFLGGDRYHKFYARIEAAIEGLLGDTGWHNLALFAHGGTNAAILGWVTGLGPAAFGIFDQATCCLNVIDIDVDSSGQITRRALRATNVTADDPAKSNRHCSDMETLARWMIERNGSPE